MKKISFKNIENNSLIFESKNKELYELDNVDKLTKQLFRSEEKNLKSEKTNPKDIQRLVRAGYSVDKIADKLSVNKTIIERYSMPIIAEINFVIEKAKRVKPIHSNSNTFEDIVNSKLYKSDDVIWNAIKPNNTWIIKIIWSDYTDENKKTLTAEFSLDQTLKVLTPINDNANELVEKNSNILDNNDSFLNDLNATRGKREIIEEEGEEEKDTELNVPNYSTNLTEALKSQKPKNNIVEFPNNNDDKDIVEKQEKIDPNNNNSDSKNNKNVKNSNNELDKNIDNTDGNNNDSEKTVDKKDKNKTTGSIKRTSVPSWDDIVFGSNDDE